ARPPATSRGDETPRSARSIARWMPPCLNPVASDKEGFGIIAEVQGGDCRPPCRRQSDHSQAILAPPKVFGPFLRTRVEQARALSGLWVRGAGFVGFVPITDGTTQP